MVLSAAGITWYLRNHYRVIRYATQKRWTTVLGTFLTVNYGFYYFLFVVEAPVVRFHRTFYNVSIVEKTALGRRWFYPTWWMANRHLQTVVGSIFSDLIWLMRAPVE